MRKNLIAFLSLLLCLCLTAPCLADALVSASTEMYDDSVAMYNNIDLAINAVDDSAVENGETFSFNKIVGARTKANGYRAALNGRGAKAMGGGVAQVATTLYLALKKLDGDVTIREKHTYGYKFAWDYADIADAILVDYKSGKDLRFKNVSGAALKISMRREGETVFCEIAGANVNPPDDPDDPDDPEEPEEEPPALYKVYRCKECITLRKSASTTSKPLAEIPLSATVLILKASGSMYKAKYDGLTGYVNRKYVKKVPASNVREIVKCKTYASLREEPDSASPRLKKLSLGALVEYIEKSTGGFAEVRYENLTGYVMTKYLTKPD